MVMKGLLFKRSKISSSQKNESSDSEALPLQSAQCFHWIQVEYFFAQVIYYK